MTGRFGRDGAVTPIVPVDMAFRLWAMAAMLAVVSACGQAKGGTEDERVAGPPVMSSQPVPRGERPYRLRVRIESSGESDVAAENLLTDREKQLPARQISACWVPPAGEPDWARSLIGLKLTMKRDGMVERLEVIDQGKMAESEHLRTLTESAIKAVIRCMPLKLPPDKYDQWREFVMYFDATPLAQR